MPLFFSIITPTYNRAHLLKKTAESVLSQQYDFFEWIIVDDGSTDHTNEVVASLADPRIRYYKIPNSERAIARNVGIQNAKGDYITFLDSDDVLYSNYLLNASLIIKNNPIPFFYLAFEFIDIHGKVLFPYKKSAPEELYKGNFLACLGVFIRKDVTEHLLFHEDRTLSGSEDYEYWLRIYARYGLSVFDQVSAAMVWHEERGELNIRNGEKFTNRILLLIQLIEEDRKNKNAFTKYQYRKLYSILYIYMAITLVKVDSKAKSFQYFWKAIKTDPFVCFSRSFLSYFYNVFRSSLKKGF